MKTVSLLFLISCTIWGCSKDTPLPQSPCDERPNSNLLQNCDAYFESWFYNKETKTCEKLGYSGCNSIGFDTESDCLQCKNK